jgi:hypothetical protein
MTQSAVNGVPGSAGTQIRIEPGGAEYALAGGRVSLDDRAVVDQVTDRNP